MADIYDFIKTNEAAYNSVPIPIVENYEWHMARHVKLTTLYINSQYETGNKEMKPFNNIVLPAVLTQHRSLAFTLKEINFFIDDAENYYKVMLVKKWHEKWARENGLEQFLEDMVEQYTDYGGTLVKKVKNGMPKRIEFQQLAFCDQTDILGGPICEKHQFTVDKLKEMEAVGWGNPKNGATASVDEVISLAINQKTTTQVKGRTIATPSKYIEVYELHGVLPTDWLINENVEDDQLESAVSGLGENDYTRQMQIVCFYQKEDGQKQGITLFKGKEKPGLYKFYKRDPIYGRALGRGAVEELFDPQVWANYSAIQQKEMLDQASKVIYQTMDQAFQTRNQTNNLEQGEILVTAEGKPLNQVNTQPVNIVLFERALSQWDAKAKEIASTFNPFSSAGSVHMSAMLGQMLMKQASSLHDWRKGKLGGIFLPEIYRDWIIPEMLKELENDTTFSSLLTMDEMEQVSDAVTTSLINEKIKAKILSGNPINPGEIPALQKEYKQLFFKGGNHKFFSIIGGELKDLPITLSVDITQEAMLGAAVAEVLTKVFSEVVPVLAANPTFFQQNPQMAKLFNDIIENSGLDPLNYAVGGANAAPAPMPAPAAAAAPNASGHGPVPAPVAPGAVATAAAQ